jgi:hypothetical protein
MIYHWCLVLLSNIKISTVVTSAVLMMMMAVMMEALRD